MATGIGECWASFAGVGLLRFVPVIWFAGLVRRLGAARLSITVAAPLLINVAEEAQYGIEVVIMHRRITTTVRRYVNYARRANLRKRLKEGALRRAKRDLRLAEESFFLGKE